MLDMCGDSPPFSNTGRGGLRRLRGATSDDDCRLRRTCRSAVHTSSSMYLRSPVSPSDDRACAQPAPDAYSDEDRGLTPRQRANRRAAADSSKGGAVTTPPARDLVLGGLIFRQSPVLSDRRSRAAAVQEALEEALSEVDTRVEAIKTQLEGEARSEALKKLALEYAFRDVHATEINTTPIGAGVVVARLLPVARSRCSAPVRNRRPGSRRAASRSAGGGRSDDPGGELASGSAGAGRERRSA
jgi:hypothetical protein